jgi:hypothetical protein
MIAQGGEGYELLFQLMIRLAENGPPSKLSVRFCSKFPNEYIP